MPKSALLLAAAMLVKSYVRPLTKVVAEAAGIWKVVAVCQVLPSTVYCSVVQAEAVLLLRWAKVRTRSV